MHRLKVKRLGGIGLETVDINSDLGESFGNYKIGNDEVILQYVTSANIACGFHGGDPQVMDYTVKTCLENHVAIGAHPGLPDLLGFGRRNIQITPQEAKAYVMYQIGALNAFVKAYGGKMQHVKPHGALYNMATVDYPLARAIAEAVYEVDHELILMGLAGGELIRAGKDVGLRTASEVFADRTYTSKGTLVPRSEKGSVIHDKKAAIKQVLDIVLNGKVLSIDGKEINIKADTICVHGDNQEAVSLVKEIRNALKENNVEITAFGR